MPRDIPHEVVPSGPFAGDDDDYDYSKLEMDVDDDSDDNHGNDARRGFMGSIVPDEDDNVSNMFLSQFGSIPLKKSGTPLRSMPANPHQTAEHQEADDGGISETPSDFHCDVAGVIVCQVFSSLGRSHARDKREAMRRIVSEIYSPPRVTAEIVRSRSRHLLPGFAMDLTTCDPTDGKLWDFNN